MTNADFWKSLLHNFITKQIGNTISNDNGYESYSPLSLSHLEFFQKCGFPFRLNVELSCGLINGHATVLVAGVESRWNDSEVHSLSITNRRP